MKGLAIGFTILIAILAVSLAILLFRKEQQLDAALNLRAENAVLREQLRQREHELASAREQRFTEVREAWDDLLWQEARLEVRRKQDSSLMMLRMLATGLGSYQVDYNMYPLDLQSLEPNYVIHLHAKDAWGNDVKYTVSKKRWNYTIETAGQDCELGTGDDYQMRDGQVTHVPDVRNLQVEPPALPGADHPPPAGGEASQPSEG